jgi:hypothetical protein
MLLDNRSLPVFLRPGDSECSLHTDTKFHIALCYFDSISYTTNSHHPPRPNVCTDTPIPILNPAYKTPTITAPNTTTPKLPIPALASPAAPAVTTGGFAVVVPVGFTTTGGVPDDTGTADVTSVVAGGAGTSSSQSSSSPAAGAVGMGTGGAA